MKLSEIDTPNLAERFWSKVDKSSDCWLWTGYIGWYGYGGFGINKKEHWNMIGAHRMAWLLEYGEIPDGLHVCHHCDNPPCVKPTHLFVGTDGDNIRDASRKGHMKGNRVTNRRGELNHVAKLTWKEVNEIRSRFKAGEKAHILADEYQYEISAIYYVLRGESWVDPSYKPIKAKWLTDADKADIRCRLERGESRKSIAKLYGRDVSRIGQLFKEWFR
jgi:hypothetical protein